MGKQEFLDQLRMALSGRMAAKAMSDTMAYYEEYINTEVRKGRGEEEVMAALGDPRLIARTIIETQGAEEVQAAEVYGDEAGEQERRPVFLRWMWLPALVILIWLACAGFRLLILLISLLPVLIPLGLLVFWATYFIRRNGRK